MSNFYECLIIYDGYAYKSTEAAYQASKCENERDRLMFVALNPGSAKRLGRNVKLRPDWDEIKIDVMRDLLYQKFQPYYELGRKLVETGDEDLVEGNTWGDTFWGVCNGVGENNLGKLLMEVRANLKEVMQE